MRRALWAKSGSGFLPAYAAQLGRGLTLCQADAGPFAAARAEALRFSQDARRHATRNRAIRESAAGGVPLCPQARGASATAYTKHVRCTSIKYEGSHNSI
jgi:hypothetical protein